MSSLNYVIAALICVFVEVTGFAAPTIDPISNVTIPAGKSLTLPITAVSPLGFPLTYTITSSTNAIAVVMHTNNPFWQLTTAQAAASNAPGAYQTPYRGGVVTVTNVGTMTFMLFPEYAPHTINVFQGLTASGFYNSNTIFHRVIGSFVIQGGDPNTNGSGGLVFRYGDEFNPQALFTGNGQLALANSGKNTDGSQFFVTVGPQRSLDFGYTLFGQLVRGFNVLTNINNTATDTNNRPLADEIIQTATYVTNSTDTVLTLTATNVPGAGGTITVVADDGAGGRVTNMFIASIAADGVGNNQALFYPDLAVTNLVAPINTPLTNTVTGVELNGDTIYWLPSYGDQASQSNVSSLSGNQFTNTFATLTYNVVNTNGRLQFSVVSISNYVGPIRLFFDVSSNPNLQIYKQFGIPTPYNEHFYTFIFGDTPISGQSNNVTALAAAPFTNVLLATFSNGVPDSVITNFASAINWGDNTITPGTISTNGAGLKTILGAHTYLYPGVYPVYVTVQSYIGASATILSYINVIATQPKLLLGAAPALGVNGFSFTLQPVGGLNGYIQTSSNLMTWVTLTNFVGTNATIDFLDPAATNSPRRFYRAIIP